jgi:thioredoxin-related protein
MRFQKLASTLLAIALSATAATAESVLVMIEEHGCVWCARWNAEIAPIYSKTSEGKAAPLRRLDINQTMPAELSFKGKLHFTPTFVLMVDGKEISRLEGYPGEDFFWGLLGQMLKTAEIGLSS